MRRFNTRLLVPYACLYVLFILYGWTHFYRDPGSIFYDPERAYTRYYSQVRQQEAESYIQEQSNGLADRESGRKEHEIIKAGQKPRVCVNFATVKRAGAQYVAHSVASLLAGLTREEREDMHVSVFFANTEPSVHPAYHEPWLHAVVDKVYTQPVDDEKYYSRVLEFEEAKNYSKKGVADYTYGLQHCYDVGAPYVLMFEGDVLVANGWFVKTLEALEFVRQKMLKGPHDWLYLRLFNQERSTGWGSRWIGGNGEPFIIMGLVALILTAAKLLRKHRPRTPLIDSPSLTTICVIIVPSLVILFFQCGKASLMPPQPGVYEQNFGCCSQALVFPREQIPRLVRYLKWRDHGQIDMMTNTHARVRKFARLSLYPVQVQHVGIKSIRGTKLDEAQAIWSMAFEDKKPAELERDHQKLVEKFYHGGEG